jgi:prophage antirepressor-like protein
MEGDLTFDNPLFLAKDVATWIDWQKSVNGDYNILMLLNLVSNDEKVQKTIEDNTVWFLTESGLFEILFRNDKPIAKAFKEKAKTVLKLLRTQGYVESKTKPEGINEFVWNLKPKKKAPNKIWLQKIKVKQSDGTFQEVICSVDFDGQFTVCDYPLNDDTGINYDDFEIVGKPFQGALRNVTCKACMDKINFYKNF